MAKVWRNSEGREFPAETFKSARIGSSDAVIGGRVLDSILSPELLRALGYELVEKEEPGEFEATASPAVMSFNCGRIESDRLIPGKTYVVREKR